MRTKVTYLIMLVCLLVVTVSTNVYAYDSPNLLPKAATGTMPHFQADSKSYTKYQSGGTSKAAKYIDIVVSFSTCLAIYSAYPV